MEDMEKYKEMFDVSFANVPSLSHLEGVIVEPRCHDHLELVLKNFVYMLPEWSLTVYHSKMNEGFVKEILGDDHGVRLVCFSDGDITINDYSHLLMSRSFWENMRGEKILIFQCDSFIRKGKLISHFLGYDYVGAPWTNDFLTIGIEKNGQIVQQKVVVGNGGLSLRTKRVMIKIIDLRCMDSYRGVIPEDVFFAIGMLILDNVRRCPVEVARSFSVETVYHSDPFGWHKAYAYWKGPHWEKLKQIHGYV